MCLYIDNKLTNKIKKKKSKTIICYKWYIVQKGNKYGLLSPFRFNRYIINKIKSDRKSNVI